MAISKLQNQLLYPNTSFTIQLLIDEKRSFLIQSATYRAISSAVRAGDS